MENQNRKEKKSKKRGLFLLALFAFAVCGCVGFGVTFAKYLSTGKVQSDALTAAVWHVELKNSDGSAMKDISSASQTLSASLVASSNANVASGKFAPGSVSYAEFVINPENTEVSVEYSFSLDTSALWSGVTVQKVVTVNSSNVESAPLTADGDAYKGEILLGGAAKLTANEAVKVRVYIEWAANGADAADTAIGVESPAKSGTVSINVTVSQKVASAS